MAKTEVIIISYIPLVFGAGGTKLEVKDIEEIFKKSEIEPPQTCIWAIDQNESCYPVLVMDRAEEIATHIKVWSEDNPSSWFEICLLEESDCYHIVLWPDLIKSKDRHLYNWMIRHEEILIEEQCTFTFLFRPLHFRSHTLGTFNKAKETIKRDEIMLGFIDKKDINEGKVNANAKCTTIGPFKIRYKHEQAKAFIDRSY